MVCTDKRKGGLGVKSLTILNRALLGKWLWRFANDPEGIWRCLICTKYGEESHGWRPREAKGPFGVGLWKEILKKLIGLVRIGSSELVLVQESDSGLITGAGILR